MKKLLSLAFILSFIITSSASALSQERSLTITSPKGGERIIPGENLTVKWKSTGYSSSAVIAIDVTTVNKSGEHTNVFVHHMTGLSNDGEETMLTSSGIPPRTDYGITMSIYDPQTGLFQTAHTKKTFTMGAKPRKGDKTPRIAYWYGKVNQHVDSKGKWQTDPDGTSGADLDKLTYCKKWYPNTVSVEPYVRETIEQWRAAGNSGDYPNSVITDKCVQGKKSTAQPTQTSKAEKVLFMGGSSSSPGSYNDVYTSSDMQKWELISPHNAGSSSKWSPRSGMLALYFKDKYWVIGGKPPTQTALHLGDVWNSTDGIAWKKVSENAPITNYYSLDATVFNGKMYILGGNRTGLDQGYQKLFSSSDGVQWTTTVLPFLDRDGSGFGVFKNKLYIIGGMERASWTNNPARGDIWTSTDGRNFVLTSNAPAWGNITSADLVSYNDKLYLFGIVPFANGSFNSQMTSFVSNDGVTWTQIGTPPFTSVLGSDVIVSDGKIWAGDGQHSLNGQNHLWYTTNGSMWTQASAVLPWSPRQSYRFISK